MCTLDATGVSLSVGDTVSISVSDYTRSHTHSLTQKSLSCWSSGLAPPGSALTPLFKFWGEGGRDVTKSREQGWNAGRKEEGESDSPWVNSQREVLFFSTCKFWTVADADQAAKQMWKDKYYYGMWREDPNKYKNNNVAGRMLKLIKF